MSDAETLRAYAAKADEYANLVSRDTPDRDLQAFLDAMPAGGRVLDLGCGPGNSAAMMRDAGLDVDALDASEDMVRIAREKHGIAARCATFDALDVVAHYHGIWANFSLLHAARSAMPSHLAAVHRALKPGGLVHIGLKVGEGEERDAIGRLYTYYSQAELTRLLVMAGFAIHTVRHGTLNGLVKKDEPFMIVTAHA